MACLTVLDGSFKGQKFALEKPVTRIGRRDGNDWVLQDGSISGTHCEIEKIAAGFLLRDLDSTNGTKVNSVPIQEKSVFRNDILLFGEVPVMLEGDDVPQAAEKTAEPYDAIPRTTIVIQPKRNLSTPKEFGKKTNSNMIWISVIAVLVLVIAALLVKMFL
jgi:FOG: FHA domain